MQLSLIQRRRRYENGYVVLASIFAVLMVLTNVIGTKLFALLPSILPDGFGAWSDHGPVILTTGLITYPLTFLFTDICSEIYGARRANMMVAIGFFASILMLLIVNVAVGLTPADRYWSDASAQKVYGSTVLAVTGQRVQIEQQQFLSDPVVDIISSSEPTAVEGMQAAQIGMLHAGMLHFGSYSHLEQVGGHFGAGYRHCFIEVQGVQPVRGDSIVPAVQLLEFRQDESLDQAHLRIRVSGGFVLPVQGVLQDAAGQRYVYRRENNNEWITASLLTPNKDDNVHVEPRPAALVNTMNAVEMQTAMVATFASPSILLAASMLAYLLAQFLDVFLFDFWKRATKGKKLWLRNNGSTWVSQFVDTITVNGIFLPLAFNMSWAATWNVIVCVYVIKLIIAALDTPFVYLAVYVMKKRLGYAWEDHVPDLILVPNLELIPEYEEEAHG